MTSDADVASKVVLEPMFLPGGRMVLVAEKKVPDPDEMRLEGIGEAETPALDPPVGKTLCGVVNGKSVSEAAVGVEGVSLAGICVPDVGKLERSEALDVVAPALGSINEPVLVAPDVIEETVLLAWLG
jgi:hypothetical protein